MSAVFRSFSKQNSRISATVENIYINEEHTLFKGGSPEFSVVLFDKDEFRSVFPEQE